MPESDVKKPEQKLYKNLKKMVDSRQYFDEEGKFVSKSITDNQIKAIKAAQILAQTHEKDEAYKGKLEAAIESIKEKYPNAEKILNETSIESLIKDNAFLIKTYGGFISEGVSQDLVDFYNTTFEELDNESSDPVYLSDEEEDKEIEKELENDDNRSQEKLYEEEDINVDLQQIKELGQIQAERIGKQNEAAKKIQKFIKRQYVDTDPDTLIEDVQMLIKSENQKTDKLHNTREELKEAAVRARDQVVHNILDINDAIYTTEGNIKELKSIEGTNLSVKKFTLPTHDAQKKHIPIRKTNLFKDPSQNSRNFAKEVKDDPEAYSKKEREKREKKRGGLGHGL